MSKFLTRKIALSFFLSVSALLPSVDAQQPTFAVGKRSGKPTAILKNAARRGRADAENFIRTELFFGRNRPDGAEISEEEFNEFLRAAITPEFPDGLTVLDGIGQFRDSQGFIIREKTKVLILLYPANAKRQANRKIERIRAAYKTQFQQQSVLRADDVLPVKISF